MPIDPNAPCMTIFDLQEGGEDIVPFEIADGFRHRAAVQRRYADEMGLEFGDVRCQRSYIVIHTWAEVWEESTDREDQIADKLYDSGFVSHTKRWWHRHSDDFGNAYYWYEYAPDLVDMGPGKSPEHLGHGWGITDDEAERRWGQMPPDWHPNVICGAYTTVDYTHPKAYPVWVCSPM